MKANAGGLIALFSCAVIALTGCKTVGVKHPAGDKVATLDAQQWEGTWRNAKDPDGRAVLSIADPAAGLVELRGTSRENPEVQYLAIRQLKDRLVATEVPKPGAKLSARDAHEGMLFFRVMIADRFAAVFMPRGDLISDAVRNGRIAGRIHKVKGYDNIVTTLDRFGAAEVDRLPLETKGSVMQCFDSAPILVVVKERPHGADMQGRRKIRAQK